MTRECDAIRELLCAYLDGECNAEETAELDAHLKGCATCREELNTLQHSAAWVSLTAEPVPEGLHERIMERIRAESAPKTHPRIPMRVLTAAVAACAVFGLALGAYLRFRATEMPFLRNLRADSAAVGLSALDQHALDAPITYHLHAQETGVWRAEAVGADTDDAVDRLILNGENATWIEEGGVQRNGTVFYGGDGLPVRLLFLEGAYEILYDGEGGMTLRAED